MVETAVCRDSRRFSNPAVLAEPPPAAVALGTLGITHQRLLEDPGSGGGDIVAEARRAKPGRP